MSYVDWLKHKITYGPAGHAALAGGGIGTPNPIPVIRMNPPIIAHDITVPADHNAYSVGPITIDDGAAVVVGDNAIWTII